MFKNTLITILRFQISVKNHVRRLFALEFVWLRVLSQPHNIAPDIRWILSVMAAIERGNQLRKDAPNKLLFSILVFVFQPLDHLSQITVAAIFHVQVEVLSDFEMFALVVLNDIRMSEFFQDGELRLKLFLLFWRHLMVTDFFSTEDLCIALETILSLCCINNIPDRPTCAEPCV
jgi:hypothetical protein